MIVEYVSQKINAIRWRSTTDAMFRSAFESTFVCGTTDNCHKSDTNKVILGSVDSAIDDTVDISFKHELPIRGDVTRVITFNDILSLVTSNAGDARLYQINETGDKLSEIKVWYKLDEFGCMDAVHISPSTAVICGKEGIIKSVDVVKTDSDPQSSKVISQTSLECIEQLSPNEVIVGNESGLLKVIDLRTSDSTMSLGYNLSIITCVKRNPSNRHIIASGNDSGVLSLWDLRSNASHLLHVAAHNALISELQYKENDNNTIITSSNDGQLLKWTLTPSSQFEKVDAIMGKEGDPAVNSFHINMNNDIIFSTDNEVLYFGQM
ncbi:hypothetical protein B4U80_13175 [Leptotrombidium deliense]|uniref:Uncharacterized protein n=1 Tax=Leptotrombidium deliense TaxID=299467 RepID=A0A443SUU0_9ACAR|nr:hypothetical protein B4U80_13175 [Leptotrombidium deliense]